MRRVFVSYSRTNLEAVTNLIRDLEGVGMDTWSDQILTGGQHWWDNILANIRECDIFVLALSPESLDSEACKSELGYVVQLGKPIVPVLVADGVNLNLLSGPLHEIQAADFRRRDKEATFAVVKAINTAPAAPPLPERLPTPPPVPVSYLGTLMERIDSADPLSPQAQITLLFELEEELRRGRSPTEVRDLFLRLKRRDDLLAKIATKIEEALKSLDAKDSRPPKNAGAQSTLIDTSFIHKSAGPSSTPKCPQCRNPVEPGTKFCPNCGTSLGEDGGGKGTEIETGRSIETGLRNIPGSKNRRYTCPPANTPRVIAEVKRWLDSQGFDSQQVQTENHGLLLQLKKRGSWRNFVGMATALNIAFYQSGDSLAVEIGAGKWVDKAAVGAVSMFVLWPLAVTAGFGAWEQAKMPEKVFDFIGSQVACK